jgi:hypothetical protein
VINYLEDSFQRYDEIVARMRLWRYTRWGWHWLPHDGDHKNPQTGKSPRMWLQRLALSGEASDGATGPEARIKAAREAFPRIMIDSTDRTPEGMTGWEGGARLLECLRRYKPHCAQDNQRACAVLSTTSTAMAPTRIGAACEIADKIIDDDYRDEGPPVPQRDNSHNPGMGTLGL